MLCLILPQDMLFFNISYFPVLPLKCSSHNNLLYDIIVQLLKFYLSLIFILACIIVSCLPISLQLSYKCLEDKDHVLFIFPYSELYLPVFLL